MQNISNLERSSQSMSQIANISDAKIALVPWALAAWTLTLSPTPETPDANASQNCCLTSCFSSLVSIVAYIPSKVLSFVTSIVSYFISFCRQKTDLEMIQAFIDQQAAIDQSTLQEPAVLFLHAFNTLPQQAKEFTLAIITSRTRWRRESSSNGINPSSREALSWIQNKISKDCESRANIIVALQVYMILQEFPTLSASSNEQDPLIAAEQYLAAIVSPQINTLPKTLKELIATIEIRHLMEISLEQHFNNDLRRLSEAADEVRVIMRSPESFTSSPYVEREELLQAWIYEKQRTAAVQNASTTT